MERCKICGEVVDILTYAHCASHGLTKENYREIYGEDKWTPAQNIFGIAKKSRARGEIDAYLCSGNKPQHYCHF